MNRKRALADRRSEEAITLRIKITTAVEYAQFSLMLDTGQRSQDCTIIGRSRILKKHSGLSSTWRRNSSTLRLSAATRRVRRQGDHPKYSVSRLPFRVPRPSQRRGRRTVNPRSSLTLGPLPSRKTTALLHVPSTAHHWADT